MGKWAIKMCESKRSERRGIESVIDSVKGSKRLSQREKENKKRSRRK